MANETEYAVYIDLIAQATAAAKAYYDTDVELMSDSEYDAIIDTISHFENKYGWSEAKGLLSEVAGGVSAGGDIVHDRKMLSLGKVNSMEDLVSFVNGMKRKVGKTDLPLVVEPKLDGSAISAKYVDGRLVQLVLRGDGQSGEDVTSRVPALIEGLPTQVPFKGSFEVRGEIYISNSNFFIANMNRMKFEYDKWVAKNPDYIPTKARFEQLKAYVLSERKGVEPVFESKTVFRASKHIFANSRNAVSGSLRRETSEYVVPMSFAAYDAFLPGKADERNHVEKMLILQKIGFVAALSLIPQEFRQGSLMETVRKFGAARKKVNFPTDGVVIKAVDNVDRKNLGEGSRTPYWAIAYKYPSVFVETVVQDIELNIGRTGRLSLRAKVAPVLLDGTLISYASMHNVNWVEEKDIRIGDTVTLKRANDVIPYIDAPVLDKRPETLVPWQAPEVCPQCGENWDKATLLWRCPSPACGALNGIIHAAKRDYFDWEGLSEAIITRLNDTGLVNDIADVFKVTKEQLANLDMGRVNSKGEAIVLGEKVAEKLYNQIQASKTRPLNTVLAALGIRTLGRSIGRWLTDEYGNMNDIVNASVEDLTKIEGIAQRKAQMIHDGLREKRDLIGRLSDAGVTMYARRAAPAVIQGQLTGRKVCVSGTVPGYTRQTVETLLRNNGATPSSSVSRTTDFLVADEAAHGNSKYQAAERLGVRILTTDEFLRMVR